MHRITLSIILLFSATAVDAASYQKTDGTIVDPIQSVEGGDLPYSGNNLEPDTDLIWEDLSNAVLNHADLSGASMGVADLSYSEMESANLKNANLGGATLYNANLSNADLTGAYLHNADLEGANLGNAVLNQAVLEGARLEDADLNHAKLEDAIFTGAISPPRTSSQLALTPLEETIIGGAQLDEANFVGADLSGAVFDHENDAYDATGWETATWTGASFHYLNPALFPTGMIHTDHGIVVRTPEPSTLLLALFGLTLLPRRRRR